MWRSAPIWYRKQVPAARRPGEISPPANLSAEAGGESYERRASGRRNHGKSELRCLPEQGIEMKDTRFLWCSPVEG